MSKIIFASETGKKGELKKVWSGTIYGLYNSLSKLYQVDHYNVGIYDRGVITFIMRTINKIRYNFLGDDMNLLNEKILCNFIKVDNLIPVLQFDETIWNNNNKRQYIFLDTYVNYINRLREQNRLVFDASAYANISKQSIQKRETYQNLFFKHVAGIFTMGKWLCNDMKKTFPEFKDKIYHVGGGCSISENLIDDSVEKKGNKFLFVGRDFKTKNGEKILEAFRILHAKRKDVELYIAGIENNGIDIEGVKVLGLLEYEELAKWYNTCDVFVMPSIFEMYGLVFIEALIFGLPCIGRAAYEMPYFIEEKKTGMLLHGGAEELADIMEYTLNNNCKMKEYVRENREFYLREYSWDTVAKRIKNVMN